MIIVLPLGRLAIHSFSTFAVMDSAALVRILALRHVEEVIQFLGDRVVKFQLQRDIYFTVN